MSKWDGKSKGTVLGYKIFVFFIKNLGVKFAYLILNFVASYYFIFLKKSNASIFYYFRKRLGYSYWKSKRMVFKSYYTFGQTIIDKIAISAGLNDKFTYQHDGGENIIKMLEEKKGGVLISAHIGNFSIAEYFFSELELNFKINLVITDLEHATIKQYLKSVAEKPKINFIIIGDDLSHIFEINSALTRNELVCFTGDRYFEGMKFLQENLLGEEALFPAGPFLIASRLRVPVAFVYVMKESNLHYHLYTRMAKVKHRDEKALLKEYAESLQGMVEKYPLQWFNYFDFWNQLDKNNN